MRILVRDTIASWWRISALPESRDWWLHGRHYSVIENMCVSLYTRLPGWQDSFFKILFRVYNSIIFNLCLSWVFSSLKIGVLKVKVRYVMQCMDIIFIFWFFMKNILLLGFFGRSKPVFPGRFLVLNKYSPYPNKEELSRMDALIWLSGLWIFII